MSRVNDYLFHSRGVLGTNPDVPTRIGDGRNIGALDVSESIEHLEDEGGVLLAGPPVRLEPRDVRAAKRLIRILKTNGTAKSKLASVKRVLRLPRRKDDKRWLHGVEKNYNHQYDYYTVIPKGGVAVLVPVKKKGQKMRTTSVLREHLRKQLGPAAEPVIKLLAKATRFQKLTNEEFAEVALSTTQRKVAIARSTGHLRDLAEWLFDDHNWRFFVKNRNDWAPTQLAGFFRLPDDSLLKNWPTAPHDWVRGDQSYLSSIWNDLQTVRKEIVKIYADHRLARGIGGGTGPTASKTVQAGQLLALLEYKKKLHPLGKSTKRADLLRKKIIPVKEFWK